MRYISTRVHGFFDYFIGLLLIAMPWVMGMAQIGGPQTWVPVIIGLGVITYSLLTDYEWGISPRINMRVHLVFDGVAAATLLISTVFFGFFDYTYWLPYLALGIIALVGTLLTDRRPQSRRLRFRRPKGLESGQPA